MIPPAAKGMDHQLSAYAATTKQMRGYLVAVLRRALMPVPFSQTVTTPVAQNLAFSSSQRGLHREPYVRSHQQRRED